MNDVAAFVAACISSPALLRSACALVIIPVLAWLVVRALAPAIARMSDDSGWQAPLAATAAGLPGMLFVVLGAATLRDGWNSACLQFASGRVLYAVVAALTAFGVARAMTLAVRRVRDVVRLIRSSSAPSARLQRAADATGMRIRAVSAAGPVVLIAGFVRPIVLVSADALLRVNDAELHAAVRHEAAHARRGDLICAAIIMFIADLVPLPVGNLIALYRRAREFAADAHATRFADPCDLAGALLALSRPAAALASVAAFADAGTVRERLGTLLAPSLPRPSRVRRSLLCAALAATFVLGAAPALVAFWLGFTCAMAMPG